MIYTMDPFAREPSRPVIPVMSMSFPRTMRWQVTDLAPLVRQARHPTRPGEHREIEVAACAPVVTLRGKVPGNYLKLATQMAFLNVPIIQPVINQLEVI